MVLYGKVIAISFLVCAISALPLQNDEPEVDTDNNRTKVDYRLPKSTAPIHYDMKLIPDIDGDSGFEGESSINFKVLVSTPDIVLNSANLSLNENATRIVFENGTILFPEAHNYDKVTEKLTIHLGTTLGIGVYWLNLQFTGDYMHNLHGVYKNLYEDEEGNKGWVVATHFEPTYARYAFPCWDEPALKATYNISIKHFDNYTALSNMPVREKSSVDETDGKVWTHFEKTPIMSSYLVAYVVADYENVSNADGTISVWGRKELLPHFKYALEIVQKAATLLEEYTNSTVRVPKMDHVALPYHASGAMENWGLITYPEINLVFNEDEQSLQEKRRMTKTMTHELAHQWFGNTVSPIWWSHIWLNEGFASYFAHYILDKMFKNWREMDNFIISILQGSLATDTQWHTNPIDKDVESPQQIKSAFSVAIYRKAPSILHMLANIVSPEVFRRGLIDYLDRHEYDAADPDCLWRALQNALDKSDVLREDINVKEVMDTWIKQKRYPLVTVERNYSSGAMKLTQEDFGLVDVHQHADSENYEDENETYQWWVPITYATQSNPDFSDTRPAKWLKPQENLTVEGIDPEDWIIVNKQQSGFYRVNYDEVNWRRIGEYLRSENFTNVHVLNRAQIISDITHLVMHERVNLSVFFDVVTYLAQEQDYTPWSHIFSLMEDLKGSLNLPEAKPLRDFILSMMENVTMDMSFEDDIKDNPLTAFCRIDMLKWTCYLGHTKCRQKAADKIAQFLDNPKAHNFQLSSPWHSKSWILVNGMRAANESVWYKAFELRLANASTVDGILYWLSFTENPTLIEAYLNASISNDTSLLEEHRAAMLRYALANSPSLDIVIDFCIQHWDTVSKRSEAILDGIYQMDNIVDDEQIEKLRKLCEAIDACKLKKVWETKREYLEYMRKGIEPWIIALNNT